jgi:hypothetical protein
MEQRNQQAGLATEGGQDAGRDIQDAYGVPEDAVADADPEAGVIEDDGTGAGSEGDVLIVDSMIEDEDRAESDVGGGGERHGAPGADGASPTDRSGGLRAAGTQMAPGSPDLSQRWHEIQATFVDDPRASVELAAAEAREAVASFVAAISQRQESLLSAPGRAGSDRSTEQLRSALQDYRTFCQMIGDFVGRLTQPVAGSAR